ncbi:DNA repair protein RadC [Desulfurispirillum indicum]|uniref:DNA repair protein RadC n=1 Tax=Desulfurispirillum indicum (strain ATCC BAA-1389 / DSM 22839 / S5) TaxID=653733 RepID=E6W163_DESIS|nr:DNA repair protein RadC [Desulfurispirillum indicum]ADU66483.1 DNA repair protein RadC [Desulfurispirillum indicum S5]UCZ55819.1 DNA repair protein RadC [Desulfurispirillum indicum]
MKDLESVDRPREKLLARGARSLDTHELVAILLGSGTREMDVMKLSRLVARAMEKNGMTVSQDDFLAINGIGQAKACQLLAAIEMGRRLYSATGATVRSYRDVIHLLEEFRHKKQEYFLSITLDGAGCVLQRRIVTIGTLNASLVHPREVFSDALTDRAASIIVAHNHPSGSVEPSQEDHNITRRLRQSGELLGIPLLDHIIISPKGEVSFKECNYL